ncbi:DUF6233 domain-containing protein [Streptomyces sp. NPDC004082]
MYDLPPDSARLRVLLTWHEMWVTRTREALAEAEKREAEEAERQQRQAPPPPAWVIAPDKVRPVLHAGLCPLAPKTAKEVSEEQALLALQQEVLPCPDCRPEVAIGYLAD